MRNRNPKQVYSPPCSIQSCRKKVSFCSCFFNRQTVSSSLLQEFQGYLSLFDWVCDILWRRTGLTATMISSRYTVQNGAKIVLKSNFNLKIESNDKIFKLTIFYKVNFMKKSREIIEISSRCTVHNGAKIVLKSNSNREIESNDKFFKLTYNFLQSKLHEKISWNHWDMSFNTA